MAIMIPTEPRDFTPESKEDIAFKALQKIDDDNYYIIHSLSISSGLNYENDREADFIIYNKYKGILVLELKNTNGISYQDGIWRYNNGKIMKRGGPYKQANSFSKTLLDLLYTKRHDIGNLTKKCQFTYAVWFLGIKQKDFEKFEASNQLPLDCHSNRTLFKEHLNNTKNLKEKIDSIFNIDVHKTTLNDYEHKLLLNNFLNPTFAIKPSGKTIREENKIIYNQYTKEQVKILSFLNLSRIIAINGGAGTGKTIIAIERALELAKNEEYILFICFNKNLFDYLSREYTNPYIKFTTAFSLLNEYTQEDFNNFIYYDKEFGYQHIIIDEGQDISSYSTSNEVLLSNNINELNGRLDTLLQNLSDIVEADNLNSKTLCIFYDEFQLVNGRDHLPDAIKYADCKFCLTKNCRNTTSIAQTSFQLLSGLKKDSLNYPFLTKSIEKKLSNLSGYADGTPPHLLFVEKRDKQLIINQIKKVIKLWREASDFGTESKITILTCLSSNSGLFQEEQRKKEIKIDNTSYFFANCSTYKGLENDGIIIIEMIPNSLKEPKYAMTCYVGASRAKVKLAMIMNASNEECNSIIREVFDENPNSNANNKALLARELNCTLLD